MPSGSNDVDIVVGLKASTYTAGMKEIKKSLSDLDKQTKDFSAHTASNMQAGAAGIQALEGNFQHMNRTVERFITNDSRCRQGSTGSIPPNRWHRIR